MKIYLVVLLFSFYSSTSAWWWDSFETFDDDTATTAASPTTTTIYSRDCFWTPWAEEPCLKVSEQNNKPKYGRIARRRKIPAVGAGKDCAGSPGKLIHCTDDEYYANLFVRVVTAALSGGGGGTSGRSDDSDDTEKKCITHDLKDSNGSVIASGRKCPNGTRRKRRVVDDLESMQRRFKRPAPRTPPPLLSVKNRDVLFLLDESGSVGPSNFKLILKMARTLVSNFCDLIRIGKDTTRVGVLSFNLEQHPQINFTDFLNKATLVNAIENDVKYYGYPSDGATCLVEALDYTRKTMFNPALTGARIPDPQKNERLVILITDGCANCANNGNLRTNLVNIGKKFENEKISIVTFVVAEKPSYCFDMMKGLADGSQCVQQFTRKNWAAFSSLTDIMIKVGCMNYWSIGPSCK